MKTLTVLLVLFAATATHAAYREYDKFKDATTITTQLFEMPVTKGSGKCLAVWSYSFKGENLTRKPDEVYLQIISVSDDWIYLRNQRNLDITFVVDGDKRWPFPIVDYSSKVGDYKGGNCLEQMTFKIPGLTVTNITEAARIEFQIQNTNFEMGELQKVETRQFAESLDLAKPPPPAPLPPPPLEDTQEYKDAVAAVDKAKADLSKAKEEADQRISSNPDVAEAQRQLEEAEAALAKAKKAGYGIYEAAKARMEASANLERIKADMISKDEKTTAAKKALADAHRKLDQIKNGHDKVP